MNTRRMSMKKINLSSVILRVVLLVVLIAYLFPLLFATITSSKTMQEFFESIWSLPSQFRIENYIGALVEGKIGEYFLNSVIIAIVSLISILVLSLLAAYALARLKVPRVNLILILLLVIQVLPTESMMIPLFIMLSKIGILRTPYAATIIAYVGWSLPGTIIILKNFFETIPVELLEAARIDGSGEFNTMTRIILPLMRGPISTCVVMNFTFVWGELMWAQISTLLTNKGIPITVGLLHFRGANLTNWPMLTAAIIIILIPLFLVFIFLQKYFVAGLTAGSVKG